jgi:hypothetical protein
MPMPHVLRKQDYDQKVAQRTYSAEEKATPGTSVTACQYLAGTFARLVVAHSRLSLAGLGV